MAINFRFIKNSLSYTMTVMCAALAVNSASMSAANAFELVKNPQGKVVRVENLFVGEQEYNVDFVVGTFGDVFPGGSLDFSDSETAKQATVKLIETLGKGAWLYKEAGKRDRFLTPFAIDWRPSEGFANLIGWRDSDSSRRRDGIQQWTIEYEQFYSDRQLWAKWEAVEAESTPEPSLILGFITLGGLMLGSKGRKTKDT